MCQGLESLISTPSTQLSLVSEGAECILISKRLFLKEANVKVLRIVTDLVGVQRRAHPPRDSAVLHSRCPVQEMFVSSMKDHIND